MSIREEVLVGYLEMMYKRRKRASCFVFKEEKTQLRLMVEIRNEMVDWPLRYQVLILLQSLYARLYCKFIGYRLPI
jgi:hypothetical protein